MLLVKLQQGIAGKTNLAKAAREIGYSPDYLNRLFREHFGKSIEQYVIECRIYDSLTFLLQTNMTVNEIALKMGWECTGNYINHFKKYITPHLQNTEKKKDRIKEKLLWQIVLSAESICRSTM